MTHNNAATYPRLATPVAFVEPEDLVAAAKAAVGLHRDFGDRANRRHARLKYVIAERGEDWARGRDVGGDGQGAGALPRRCRHSTVPDHLGWHEQGDGTLVSRHPGPERADRRRRRRKIAHGAARDRHPVRLRPDPDAEPGHHPQRDPPARIAMRSRRRCARITSTSPTTCCRRSAGRSRARHCRPAAWR